jgi:tungstate transport system ATP-binding protein
MNDHLYALQNVRHRYGDRPVLRIAEMAIARGEILALVGPSGAGKSTLLRLLAMLEAPTEGSLTFQSGNRAITLANASLADRRRIAMLFQRPALLSRPVRDNVAYGLAVRGEKSPAKVDQALGQVGLAHLASAQPRTLSGGEMQRAALARLLVLRPEVLLLDEPTANLDPANVRLIEGLIREHNQKHGTTIVVVTHNVFQARRLAARSGLLLDGELVELAPTEQFFSAPRDPRTAAFTSGEFVY